MKLIALAVIVILVVAAVISIARQNGARSDVTESDQEALDPQIEAAQRKFALIVLRRAPAQLQSEGMEATARSAWSGRFGENEDGTDYVDRCVPGLMCVLQAHGNAFTVICTKRGGRTVERPLIFRPASAVGLWAEYTHDISVGVAYNYDTDPARLAAFVSTLTEALCDDQSIAIYHPATHRLWELDESIRTKLRDGSLAFFDPTGAESP